jgi:hypothetical protein
MSGVKTQQIIQMFLAIAQLYKKAETLQHKDPFEYSIIALQCINS